MNNRINRRAFGIFVTALLSVMLSTDRAGAQDIMPPPPAHFRNDRVKPSILTDVGIDQKLGDQVPADLVFKDENGKDVHLGDYFGKRPIILTLVYFDCPMLCTMVLNDTLRTIRAMDENVGSDFDILTISFDPRETSALAREKKVRYVTEYNRPGGEAGWHFLTGNEENIKKLTSAVGFKYKWDAKNKVFAHASGIIVLTPEGKVSKYFFGIDYVPLDIRLALKDAGGDKVGGLTDTILSFCFCYDPATGKYGLRISHALQIGGLLTLLGLGSFIGLMIRRSYHAAPLAGDQHSGGPPERHGKTQN